MTENEKAEAYDKALERARAINNGKDVDVESGTTICEYIFPELKESEDEKIRKEIISILRNAYWTSNRNRFNELVAWLEKQGEQASSQTNERVWLYLVSDVLTWKDGIGQYLDDPRVQELAKRLCSKYSQKLYNPSKFALENQWISVEDDLPCNHEELLNPDDKRNTSYIVAIIHGYVIMSRMYKLNGKWHWENDEPTHWFPIPKLP